MAQSPGLPFSMRPRHTCPPRPWERTPGSKAGHTPPESGFRPDTADRWLQWRPAPCRAAPSPALRRPCRPSAGQPRRHHRMPQRNARHRNFAMVLNVDSRQLILCFGSFADAPLGVIDDSRPIKCRCSAHVSSLIDLVDLASRQGFHAREGNLPLWHSPAGTTARAWAASVIGTWLHVLLENLRPVSQLDAESPPNICGNSLRCSP